MSADMVVERVEDERGSHIEPPMDRHWSHLKKLQWHAAVVFADTGVRITVTDGGLSVKKFGRWRVVPDMYGYSCRYSSGGPLGFNSMWAFLNGVALGSEIAHREAVSS